MPAARHISRSPCMALAVIATMRGRLASGPSRVDAARGFEAIHLGHLHVHQHHIIGLALDALDRLDAIGGQVGAVAHLLQQAQRELLVHHVVLGQEDAQRVAGGHLRVYAGLDWRGNAFGRGVVRQKVDQRVEQLALPQRLGQGGGEETIAVSSLRRRAS